MKKEFIFILLTIFLAGSALAQNRSYRIKKDESIDSVAKKFDVSKKDIISLNPDLSSGKMEGKVIIIPARETDKKTPSATGIHFKEYKVKKGETIYGLAKKHGIEEEDIKKYNSYLYKEELGENDMIRIPIFEEEDRDFNASLRTSTFGNIAHVVMPKETKYGISKEYNMSIEELDSLNPLIEELRPGQVLKVINHPTKGKAKDAEGIRFIYYDVQPKETLYSLIREYGVSEDSLELFNPLLKELGLQAGMELKIPQKEGIGELRSTKVDLSEFMDNTSKKRVSILLPFNLRKVSDDKSDNRDLLKKDEIMGMSLDLYSGVKFAADSIRNMGIPVDIHVYDTEGSQQKITEIIKDPEVEHSQFIFGPLLAPNIQTVAREFRNRDVAIFSPLVSHSLQGSDKIFQTRPSPALKQELLLSYLDSLKNEKNILILSDGKNSEFVKRIVKRIPAARKIQQKESDYLQKSDITPSLKKDESNWIIIATDDYGLVSNGISTLNAVRKNYDIRILTADKNKIYDEEVPKEYLSNLKLTYPSTNKKDVSTQAHDKFIKAYSKQYGIPPNAYAIRGFDIAFDAFLRAASSSDIIRSLKRHKGITEYVENRFNYSKKTKDGYVNQGIFLIQFEDDLSLKVLN